MKYLYAIIISVVLFGCDNTAELASSNMKKGDDYFAMKEYEVAQYYYEKIPGESPLYKEAEMKLQRIDDIQKNALPTISVAEEATKVTIFDQSITSNASGVSPVHSVSLNNESVHKLASVELEFTYYDAAGKVVGVKRCKIPSPMLGKSQETFTGIATGSLDAPCTTSKIKVLSAEFQ